MARIAGTVITAICSGHQISDCTSGLFFRFLILNGFYALAAVMCWSPLCLRVVRPCVRPESFSAQVCKRDIL